MVLMFLYILVTKISSVIGEEVKLGLMQLNGQAKNNITSKIIEIGKLVIKMLVK